MVGAQQQVAAEQLVGFTVQAVRNAVGEKADAGETGHRDDDGKAKQMQLARSQVTQHHAEGESQGFHGGLRPCHAAAVHRGAGSRCRTSSSQ
jgi:hypothetical protein